MKIKRIFNKILYVVAVIVFSLFPFFESALSKTVFAASSVTTYTDVMTDLRKDENFIADDYPTLLDDYSLQVIAIAESEDLELFVYVYRPSAEHKGLSASTINISTVLDGLDFTNYRLTRLSEYGVFQKYKVENLQVSTENKRVYEISNIYRFYDEKLGDDSSLPDDNDNTITEVSYGVGKRYVFESDTVTCTDVETIEITDKYVGFMRYPADSFDFPWEKDQLDIHFVAFSTDRQIDELLEADVYYVSQDYKGLLGYQEKIENKVTLRHDVEMECSGNGWFSLYYKWQTIEKGADFIVGENATHCYKQGIFDSKVTTAISNEDLQTYIGSMDWVLRFAVTEYETISSAATEFPLIQEFSTIVGEVSILRLEFVADGETYNLGVVDNKQTGSTTPDNETTVTVELSPAFKTLFTIILLGLGLCLLLSVLAPIGTILGWLFKAVWWVVKTAFKAVWFLITLPFKLIGTLFKKKTKK